MNPLSHLIGKNFKGLTVDELTQVMYNYCDENNYPYEYKEFKTTKEVIFYFEKNFYSIGVLNNFFNFWTK